MRPAASVYSGPVKRPSPEQLPDLLATAYALVLAGMAVAVSFPTFGELVFRGYFVQDADEVIRAWYGRCALTNPYVIPYSHLSMPGWTALLAVAEAVGRLLHLPLTLGGRLITVAASWWCLRSAAGWVRAVGGTPRHALITVALIGVSPAFFVLSLSVYPSVALAALTVAGLRAWAEGRGLRAALLLGWAPWIRWEGALLVALMLVVMLSRRAWRWAGVLLVPYAVYLVSNAFRFGNPWKPMAYRTTKAMGSWLIFNPAVPADRMQAGLWNLVTLYSPLILLCGLPVALWAVARHRRRLGPLPWAYGGLTVALLSIHHEWMVWALRVFVTPWTLGLLCIVGVAVGSPRRVRAALFGLAAAATLVSTAMSFAKINDAKVPPPGRHRSEVGFHMMVRYGDAGPAVEWLHARHDLADWIIVNHLNANLLRADPTCSLYDLPIRMGNPQMSLSRDFVPVFGRPPGSGLIVFHALAYGVEDCALEATFEEAHLTVYRCPGTEPAEPR